MNGLAPKPASTCLYLVLQSRGAWWVDREGKSCGPCDTKEEAEGSAFHLIELFGDPASPVEVWSPDDSGKMRMIWRGEVETYRWRLKPLSSANYRAPLPLSGYPLNGG